LFFQAKDLLLPWNGKSPSQLLAGANELDGKWKVAKEMVGRRLSQEEAKRLLAKLE
jgi:hypothetical protein